MYVCVYVCISVGLRACLNACVFGGMRELACICTYVWKQVCEGVPGRSTVQCMHRWSKILRPGLVKGPWSPEEDLILKQYVDQFGTNNWKECCKLVKGRNGKQCRERWANILRPSVKKGDWTPEEDKIMFEMQQQIGSQWTKIAEYLPGRTENSIKNRYYCTLRKFAAPPKKKVSLQVSIPSELPVELSVPTTQFVEPADDEVCSLVRQIAMLEELLTSTRGELDLLEKEYEEGLVQEPAVMTTEVEVMPQEVI